MHDHDDLDHAPHFVLDGPYHFIINMRESMHRMSRIHVLIQKCISKCTSFSELQECLNGQLAWQREAVDKRGIVASERTDCVTQVVVQASVTKDMP